MYFCSIFNFCQYEFSSKLSRHELLSFRDWFSEFDAAAWDRQFAEDVSAGHLDSLADEAVRDLREGRCRDL